MKTTRRYVAIGAGTAALGTAIVGAAGLAGVSSIPIAELLVFPGSMIAWWLRGDNYASAQEFLLYSTGFGVPLNAVVGAGLGGLWSSLRRDG